MINKRKDPPVENFGVYSGDVETKWLPNGRDMRVLSRITFVDPDGTEWAAEAGDEVNGASIPRLAWTVVGSPLTGKYRVGSVFHDVACQNKLRSWRQTHLMFYNAMRASGVSETSAKVFYGAVYHFGPRWGIAAVARSLVPIAKPKEKNFHGLEAKIKAVNLSLAEIEQFSLT